MALKTDDFSLTNIFILFKDSLLNEYGYKKSPCDFSKEAREKWIEDILKGVVDIRDSDYSDSNDSVSLIKEFTNRSKNSAFIKLREAIAEKLLDNNETTLNGSTLNRLYENVQEYYEGVFSVFYENYKRKKARSRMKDAEKIKAAVLESYFKEIFSYKINAGQKLFDKMKTDGRLGKYECLTWLIIIACFDDSTEEELDKKKGSKGRKNAKLFNTIVELRLKDQDSPHTKKLNDIAGMLGKDRSVIDFQFDRFFKSGGRKIPDILASDKIDKIHIIEYSVLCAEYYYYYNKKMEEAEIKARAGLEFAYSDSFTIDLSNILYVLRLHNILILAFWRQRRISEEKEEIESADKLFKKIPFLKEFALTHLGKEEVNAVIEKQYREGLSPSTAFLKSKGLYYSKLGMLNKTFELYRNELNLLWELDETRESIRLEKARILNNLASLYRRKKQYGKMHQSYDRSFKYRENCSNKEMLAGGYVGLSLSYRRIWRFDKAKESIMEAVKLREDLFSNNKIWLSLLLSSMFNHALADLFTAARLYSENDSGYRTILDNVKKQAKSINEKLNEEEKAKDEDLYTKIAALFSINFFITILDSKPEDINYSKTEDLCGSCFEAIRNAFLDVWEKEGYYFDIYIEAAKAKIAAAFCQYMGKGLDYIAKAEAHFKEAWKYIEILKKNDDSHDPDSYCVKDLEAVYRIEYGRLLLDAGRNDDAREEFTIAKGLAEELCVPDIELEEYRDDNRKAFEPILITAKALIAKCDDPRAANDAYRYTDKFLFEVYLVNTIL